MLEYKTLFIKHIGDLKYVHRNKKKEKGESAGCQVSSRSMSNPLHIKN
jgi:hypothetical protein